MIKKQCKPPLVISALKYAVPVAYLASAIIFLNLNAFVQNQLPPS